MRPLLVLALAVVVPSAAASQSPELPPIIERGFEILVKEGPANAIEHWMAQWETEEDLLKKAQLKSGFNQMWDMLGTPVSYEIVDTQWIGSHVVNVYAVMVHRNQPLYVTLTAYEAPRGWMVSKLNANTSVQEVFPEWLLAAWVGS